MTMLIFKWMVTAKNYLPFRLIDDYNNDTVRINTENDIKEYSKKLLDVKSNEYNWSFKRKENENICWLYKL